ncbi:MAG: response regulator transcription factor [Sphingobacteriales bacterium]|nr:response regulator transcription factor [Sphingobacteriales bacterium]
MDVLIIEDEGLLARRLQGLLEETDPRIQIAGITHSIKDTLTWLARHEEPDLLFMDIELADGPCFDIFEHADIRVPVIFTTAYDEYTLQAFKVNSVDYLLKPIKKEELKKAWEKFLAVHYQKGNTGFPEQIQQLLKSVRPVIKNRSRFLVKKGQKLIPVEVKDIAYFTIRNGVSFLHCRDKQKFTIDYTLDEVEEMLDTTDFFRANRQFILSHSIVLSAQPWFNSKLKIEISLPADEDIIVSRERAAAFKEWLGA